MLLKCLLVVMLCCITLSTADKRHCSCKGGFKHIQDLYCDADFVIKVKVNSRRTRDRQYVYNVNVREVYKGSDDLEDEDQQIYSLKNPAKCGVKLAKDITYVLAGHMSGDELRIDQCTSYIGAWLNMTSLQKRALERNRFERNCESRNPCTVCVLSCDDPPDEDTCNIPQVEQQFCYYQQTYCQRRRGKCHFRRSKGLKKCLGN